MISDLSKGIKATLGTVLVIAAISFGWFAVDTFVDYVRADVIKERDAVVTSFAEYRRTTEEASKLAAATAVDTNTRYREREKELRDEVQRVLLDHANDRTRWGDADADATKRLRLAEEKLGRALSKLAARTHSGTGQHAGTADAANAGRVGAEGTTTPGLVHESIARRIGEIYERHYGPIGIAGDELIKQFDICYRVVASGSQPIRRAQPAAMSSTTND